MQKIYLKDFYGSTGSITPKKDGTAKLIIYTPQGVKVLSKMYKSIDGAKRAFKRYGE